MTAPKRQERLARWWAARLESMRRLGRVVTAPSPRMQGEVERQRALLFHRVIIVVLPLIALVGIVMMPAVSRVSPVWRAPTFLPATIAIVISVVALLLSRFGRFREGALLYALMFIGTPALSVIQGPTATNLPIATLMMGGALVIAALFDEILLPAIFVALVVGASFAIPMVSPQLGAWDAAAMIAANVTNGAMVVTFAFYRKQRESHRRAVIERAYGQLQEQQQLFDSLVANLPGVLFRASAPPARALQYLSRNFTAVTGHGRDSFVDDGDHGLMDIVVDEDHAPLHEQLLKAIHTGARYDVEYRIRTGSGALRWWRESGRRVTDEAGDVWLDSIAIDVTDARQNELQLREAQKLESIGMLAGGLAHDFNNILTVIIGAMSLARLSLDEGGGLNADEMRETIDTVEGAAGRAKFIVDQLLEISRPQAPTLVRLDLTASARHVMKLLERSLDKSIRLAVETPSSGAPSWATPCRSSR